MMSHAGYAWMTGGPPRPAGCELVNADADMAHGLVIMPAGTAESSMPMMTAAPSFAGSALWFLGKPTAAGMHSGTIAFTAAAPGSYQYLADRTAAGTPAPPWTPVWGMLPPARAG